MRMAKAQITLPLEIQDVQVLKTEINPAGEVIITVESTKKETRCRKCGRTITKFHGYDDWVQVRYLPVFGRASYLRYRPRRYQCMTCADHATTTQRLEWHDPFLVTLETWWEEITAFFVARANSGFVEGLNNKLKVLKRRCYGLFNRQHWFQRIFLDLEGYRRFGLA